MQDARSPVPSWCFGASTAILGATTILAKRGCATARTSCECSLFLVGTTPPSRRPTQRTTSSGASFWVTDSPETFGSSGPRPSGSSCSAQSDHPARGRTTRVCPTLSNDAYEKLSVKRYVARVGALLLAGMLISCGGGGDGGDRPSGGGTPVATNGGKPNAPTGGTPTTPPTGGTPATPPTGGTPTTPPTGGTPTTPPTGGTPTTPPVGGTPTTPPPPPATVRFEESDTAVILSGVWTPSTSRGGWSGGTAMESTALGASASFAFTGTSVRWIGRRSQSGGIARVSVDGRDPIEVDLYSEPNEIRTSVITLYDLGEGPHTLTLHGAGRRKQ